MIKNCDIVLSLQHLFLGWIIKDVCTFMKVIRDVWILQSELDSWLNLLVIMLCLISL